jgi:hypothetical protein
MDFIEVRKGVRRTEDKECGHVLAAFSLLKNHSLWYQVLTMGGQTIEEWKSV